jgi:uncharacterized phage protein (TIGR01671 family)
MNREIKFRAFDSKEKRFIDLFDYDFWIRDDGIVSKISYDYDGDGRYDSSESPQLHIILTQYTGLKDKNGKDIYEGDVCRYDLIDFGPDLIELTSLEGVVEYKNGCFFLNGLEYKPSINNYCIRYLTVIGNIYENPELLNQKV